MNRFIGTKLEHSISQENIGKSIIVAVEDGIESELPVAAVADAAHLLNVAKYYAEDKKAVYIWLESTNFDSSVNVARKLGCGVVFSDGTAFERVSSISPVELERYAASNGIGQNWKRIAAIYAGSVPFKMLRKQAEDEIGKVVVDQDDAAKAVELFERILLKNRNKASCKNSIAQKSNVSVKEFPFRKFSQEGLMALREEMRAAYAAGGVYVWKLPMGIGKTLVINELIAMAGNFCEKTAYIAPRVNISRAIKESIAHNYLSDKIVGEEDKLGSLSICVNSIMKERFQVFLDQAGIIILEEVEQMIAHIAEGECRNRVEIYNELIRLIKKAKLVIAVDANANAEVIEFLQHAHKEINVLSSISDNSGIEIAFGEESSVQRMIVEAAEAKQKCIITIDTLVDADKVRKIFDDQGLRSLVITAKTRDFPEVVEFIADPNGQIGKYDGAIIYNSAMQSSTSIDETWADYVFAVFKGVVRVSDACQMLRRYRPAKKIVVSIDYTKKSSIFNENINKQYNISDIVSEAFNATAVRIHTQNVEEKANYQQNLALQIELEGYTITHLGTDELADKAAKKVFRCAGRDVRKATIARLLEAAKSGEIKSLMNDRPNLSQARIDQECVIFAAETLGLSIYELDKIQPEDAEFFTRQDARKILRNASCWLFSHSRFDQMAIGDDSASGIDKKNLRVIRDVLSGFMMIMGVSNDGEGVADVDAAIDYVKNKMYWFEQIKLITAKKINFETRNQKTALINNILSNIGLSLKRYKVSGEYCYKLNKNQFLQIANYIRINQEFKRDRTNLIKM